MSFLKDIIHTYFLRENLYPRIVPDYKKYAVLQTEKFCSSESTVKKWSEGQKRYLKKMFGSVSRSKKILDIACGDGVGLSIFKKMGFHSVAGVEFQKEKAEIAKRTGFKVFGYDMHDLHEIHNETYDIVYSSHTLEHAYYPVKMLRELRRILKNEGFLYMVLPYPDVGHWDDEAHGAKYQLGTHLEDGGVTVKRFFELNGFSIQDVRYDSFRQPEIWLVCSKRPLGFVDFIQPIGTIMWKTRYLIERVKDKYKQIMNTYYHYNHLRWFYSQHRHSIKNRKKTLLNYFRSHKIRKLQLGSGEFLLKGWLNTELYGGKERFPLDLLEPFPLPDNSFNYVYSEHTIEHFTYDQGVQILKESFRILKKGGKIRISTPDLFFLIKLYYQKKTSVQKQYLQWAAEVNYHDNKKATDTFIINNFVRAWGHKFIYDYKTLKTLLEEVGFKNVRHVRVGQSSDPNLRNIESHWKSFTKEFNLLETLCVEAKK